LKVLPLIQSKPPLYLQYVLGKGLITPQDFIPLHQLLIWLNIDSKEKAQLLRKYGFDINIRDSQGYTPLLRLIKASSTQATQADKVYPYLNAALLTSILIENGADITLTVNENGEQKNVVQLNTDPQIAEVLRKEASRLDLEDLFEESNLR